MLSRLQYGRVQRVLDFEVVVVPEVRETRSAFLLLLVPASHHEPVDVHRYGHDDFSRAPATAGILGSAAYRRGVSAAELVPVAVAARGRHGRQLAGFHAFPFGPAVLKPYFHLPKTTTGVTHGPARFVHLARRVTAV